MLPSLRQGGLVLLSVLLSMAPLSGERMLPLNSVAESSESPASCGSQEAETILSPRTSLTRRDPWSYPCFPPSDSSQVRACPSRRCLPNPAAGLVVTEPPRHLCHCVWRE